MSAMTLACGGVGAGRGWRVATMGIAALALSAGSARAQDNVVALEYFDFTAFSDLASLSTVGDAVILDTTRCRLTPSDHGKAGALWHAVPQRLDEGFQLVFRFQISNGSAFDDPQSTRGGDGLAFVIQNNDAFQLGGGGGDIGYAGIPNSLAVEFDMFNNGSGDNDPNDNHITIQSLGARPNSHFGEAAIAQGTPGVDMADGAVHTARVDYSPGRMRVYMDNLQVPVVDVQLDLHSLAATEGNPSGDSILNPETGTAYIGFTAGTGAAIQNQDILYFTLRTGLPCAIDYNGDNQIDPDDLSDFITDFFADPVIPGPGGFAVACPENVPPYDQGYKVGFGSGCNAPNPDTLGDFITTYFLGCNPVGT